MQKRRNLLGTFYRLLANPSEHITMLEQSLQEIRQMLDQRTEENAALKEEQNYIYDTLRRRSGYRFDMQFDDSNRMILFATSCDVIIKKAIVYVPRERLQIAEINTRATSGGLKIEGMYLDFVQCSTRIGKLILQKLIAQARASHNTLIEGDIIDIPNVSFAEQTEFYRQAGFSVFTNDFEGVGSLLFVLEDEHIK